MRQVSRRDALRWSLSGTIGVALLGLSESTDATPGKSPPGKLPPYALLTNADTTLDSSVVFGPQRVPGLPYRTLTSGPAVETLVREELCARSRTPASRRIGLATFGHLTDTHVLDAANPARLTFLWQYFGVAEEFPSSGRFRPHELLTVHVLDAMVRKLNTVQHGPVGHRPLDCLVTTGDLTNASALSELSAAVGVFAGKPVSSHPAGYYEGVQDHGPAPAELFRRIWHPEPETLLRSTDDWKAVHGYPTVPGLLAAATRPVPSEGADFPWYLGFGNHDEAWSASDSPSPRTAFADALRVSDRLAIQLPPGVDKSDFWRTVNGSNATERSALITSLPSRAVRASGLRRAFSKTEFRDALAGNAGHARFPSDSDAAARAEPYYTFEVSPQVTGIMLNTASPDTSTKAVIDAVQAEWLEEQLLRVSGKYYDSQGRLNTTKVQDRLVVLFSHHPLFSFIDGGASSDDSQRPLNRSAVLELLSRFPNVIAWMNGHRHKHRVTPHKGEHELSGFWEITTASLIDYPQQSRIVEILDNGDSTLSITATLVDHSVPTSVPYEEDQSPPSLAALSLELASNRPGLDHDAMIGRARDQNVNLLLRKPY